MREKPAMRRKRTSIRRRLRYRWRRIKRLPWLVLAILGAMAVTSSLVGLRDPQQGPGTLWLNLGTELAGAMVTYVLLDLVLGTRQRREVLTEQMSSEVSDVARAAAEELGREGWLFDGSLCGTLLRGARLEGAHLEHANLKGCILQAARLSGAHLERASLQGANLRGADLKAAHLQHANLSAADLEHANLQGTDLRRAHLERGSLWHAKLQQANLSCCSMARAELCSADLEGADLSNADLREANLAGANLLRASVSAAQLAQVASLAGATLPDGRQLSADDR